MSKTNEKAKSAVRRSDTKSRSDVVDFVMLNSKEGDIYCRAQAERLVDNVFSAILSITENGNTLTVSRFGSFSRVTRKSRNFKTPQGKHITKGPTDKLVFTSSKAVTKRFNADDSSDENE